MRSINSLEDFWCCCCNYYKNKRIKKMVPWKINWNFLEMYGVNWWWFLSVNTSYVSCTYATMWIFYLNLKFFEFYAKNISWNFTRGCTKLQTLDLHEFWYLRGFVICWNESLSPFCDCLIPKARMAVSGTTWSRLPHILIFTFTKHRKTAATSDGGEKIKVILTTKATSPYLWSSWPQDNDTDSHSYRVQQRWHNFLR